MKPKSHATLSDVIPVILVLTVHPQERDQEAQREEEMRSLLDTGGRSVQNVLRQHLQRPHAATYIGSGKIKELAELAVAHGAQEVAFDVSLSPSQQRNLEEGVGVKVIDYDELIIDIFARNARTHQATLAVELARMEYTKTRLKRLWSHLDRQSFSGSLGGTSGGLTGTGEKQIEMDRRLVRKRILTLKRELDEISERTDRKVQKRANCFNICLVGYTNAGKSTLMNALTRAGVLAEDRLFATLDTRSHRLFLEGVGRSVDVVLSDTVGFIRNLPPTLIASFHATLAEVREADLLLHVIDAASPVMAEQVASVEEVLTQIGAAEVPRINVFNKTDRPHSRTLLGSFRKHCGPSVAVSAITGDGLDHLRTSLESAVLARVRTIKLRVPVADGAIAAFIRRKAAVLSERWDETHGELTITADDNLAAQLRENPAIEFV